MLENFELLNDRIIDALEKSDLEEIRNKLSNIKTPTIVSGVGGSKVVSNYVSKVLTAKNNIISTSIEPRDILYMNLENYYNIISCSYGGNNYGVRLSFNNHLKHYLLSKNKQDGIIDLQYQTTIKDENSFISLAATMIPMSIMLSYYLDNDLSLIYDILNTKLDFAFDIKDIYEILCGYESITASHYLDSTLTEAGIGIPIIHSKYDYCHGRTTITKNYNSNMILLNDDRKLDKRLIKTLIDNGKDIIVFKRKYQDDIINDYYLTYLSMLFTKEIALKKGVDLSNVNYSPMVKKLYYYKEEM
jgi:hypothetical protein